jgi:hypothetical protein
MSETQDIDIRKNVQFGVHDGDILTGDYYAPRGVHKPCHHLLYSGGEFG